MSWQLAYYKIISVWNLPLTEVNTSGQRLEHQVVNKLGPQAPMCSGTFHYFRAGLMTPLIVILCEAFRTQPAVVINYWVFWGGGLPIVMNAKWSEKFLRRPKASFSESRLSQIICTLLWNTDSICNKQKHLLLTNTPFHAVISSRLAPPSNCLHICH